jgi:glycosyltransferase involved in cell wall biosynthesis
MEAERLRIAMFSTMVAGGAGYAALRVHDALRLAGADSTLYVGRGEHGRHAGVTRLRAAEEGPQPPRVPGLTIFSVDAPGIPDAELDEIGARADIFNLHWYARFLSLRNIERLSRSGKPVVITIRDMNPLSGGCHFFHGCDNWLRDCEPCPQFIPDDLPLPNATFEAKRALWNIDNIAVVVLSDHTRAIVKQSPLLGRCRVEKIPNPIDVSIFMPHDRNRARVEFGIPENKKAIAYLPSFSSSVKGAAQAMDALRRLADERPAGDCVVVCAGDLDKPLDVPFETINAGFIADKKQLARFYAAADLTLVPSTEETFSNTVAESVACGTPVAGFQVGAIPEIAQGARGRAVPVDDTAGLAAALTEILSEERAEPTALHSYVVETFGAREIGRRYLRLFEDLHDAARAKASGHIHVDASAGETARRFDTLLHRYRARRSAEIDEEQAALRQERRSLRGRLALASRAARLFFADNRAFRRQMRSLLSDRG